MPNIHPTALVDKKAHIAEDVTIGPFSIIEPDVVIGDGTSIASHVLLANGARIGANCNIHKGTVVATFPQDLKFKGEASLLIIDDGTTVREFCTLNRGTHESGQSRVGKDCLLMAYAHVAHDCVVGDHVILANGVQLGGHVHIEEWAIIGGFTPVPVLQSGLPCYGWRRVSRGSGCAALHHCCRRTSSICRTQFHWPAPTRV